MFLKHELWFIIWFGAIVHVLVQTGACCPIYLRWSLDFLPLVSLGIEVREECFAPCQNTKRSKETHQSSKVRCFLRSCLLPGSTSMPISCFHISSGFKAWTYSRSLFLMTWTFRDLPRLILVNFGNLHFFIMFDMFGVIFKTILRRSQSNILLFCFKIGVWPTSMFLKHEV